MLDARSVFLCSRRCSWLRLFAVLPGSLWTVLSCFMLAFVLVVMFHFFSRYGDNYVLPRPPPTIPICYYHHSCHYHDYGNYYQVMCPCKTTTPTTRHITATTTTALRLLLLLPPTTLLLPLLPLRQPTTAICVSKW